MTMDVFGIHENLVKEYESFIRSFVAIRDERIAKTVDGAFADGRLWPPPLIQLNPFFEPGASIDELVVGGVLHPECAKIFRGNKSESSNGVPMRLHRHQAEAIGAAGRLDNYVLTTGTGSGKSLAYIIPIVDRVLRSQSKKGIKAIIVYPMNALANSQMGELDKFLKHGYGEGMEPVTYRRYTGQEKHEEREEIKANPPDILLTNYMMLELMLTRTDEQKLIEASSDLQFLVLDELHTYRGRQGADVAMLVRRLKVATGAQDLQIVGTSATMSSGKTLFEQRQEVASVATRIFGAPVHPPQVIGETLQRMAPGRDFGTKEAMGELSARMASGPVTFSNAHEQFVADPLVDWVEQNFGLRPNEEGGLSRAMPISIAGDRGGAELLVKMTGADSEHCKKAINDCLMAGYGIFRPNTQLRVFAFRLHQFISRGDTVYASWEPPEKRFSTLFRQKFVPGDESRMLFPLAFCRSCGQEYYVVNKVTGTGLDCLPRDLDEKRGEDDVEPGVLFLGEGGWEDIPGNYPDDWMEVTKKGELRVKSSMRKAKPELLCFDELGRGGGGHQGWFMPTPFRFCLNCGIAHATGRSKDFNRLGQLSAGGRSSATTILSLATVNALRGTDLEDSAKKVLSFSDNRQDAALQAGHFNDFVQIGLLRAAIYAAVSSFTDGLEHDRLAQEVFRKLDLDFGEYASNPLAQFAAKKNTEKALRDVLGYRIYRDLRRGWRVTLPNLEQCGLLKIQYDSLEEISQSESLWVEAEAHEALLTATPERRLAICKAFLDMLRKELCVKVDYLDAWYQERIKASSSQHLVEPWGMGDSEKLHPAPLAIPGPRPGRQGGQNFYVSWRGRFGQYLGRPQTFPEFTGGGDRLKMDDKTQVIEALVRALVKGGLLEPATRDKDEGYLLQASCIRWLPGDGKAEIDPIRTPRAAEEHPETNAYFTTFYCMAAGLLTNMKAEPHTAQVNSDQRREREAAFREGELPVLYCSPTMELGVDIRDLNAVLMRNVPPTPANYAQRSGRAGRSGQPAIVITYCSTGSGHDQYFFRKTDQMVAGAVKAPALDLTNRDLILSHVHAVWLAESGASLRTSLGQLLDISGSEATLAVMDDIQSQMMAPNVLPNAMVQAGKLLEMVADELADAPWYTSDWLEHALKASFLEFDRACGRWRSLYRAAQRQQATQNGIILDSSKSTREREQARRLRGEAESQLRLLTESTGEIQGDFYSYRYFASEGFLPGYNFPRLPLSAYIPGRRASKKDRDDYISRPRFLAISEFGPRSIIYHEGARYRVQRVIISPDQRQHAEDGDGFTIKAKRCDVCGYLHPEALKVDVCENCESALPPPLQALFKLTNVATRRLDRINADEEERVRFGYDVQSAYRFADREGGGNRQVCEVMDGETCLAELIYGHAAELWRINLGWRRRANKKDLGFGLNMESGDWCSDKAELAYSDEEDRPPDAPMVKRVVPYVQDRRNCLVFSPTGQELTLEFMASLQAALKKGIQAVFQVEDMELSVEPLPSPDERRQILIYESSEGGAGVLRQLVDNPLRLAEVAREALSICHFDPDTGENLGKAEHATEECTIACYDCLMDYANQPDHLSLNRRLVRDYLMDLVKAEAKPGSGGLPRQAAYERMLARCDSQLERDFLTFLYEGGHRLPDDSQKIIFGLPTKPDFLYHTPKAAVYVDGAPHDHPEQKKRDEAHTDMMEDAGYWVIRVRGADTWQSEVDQYPDIFASPSPKDSQT
jgi:superfamily II DNA/RNA helicase